MTAVHQFVPSLAERDAIGSHVLQVQQVLREMGYTSDLYVGATDLADRPDVHPYQRFDPSGEPTWLLYQASVGSPMARFLERRPEPKIVNYHNITPPEFFEAWEPDVTTVLDLGQRQLRDLAPLTDLAIADSEFNAEDLLRAGYPDTEVVPILLDPAAFPNQADSELATSLTAAKAVGGVDWLFVGRISPNKAQHDLIKAFAAYRVAYDPEARLRLVGGSSSGRYLECLERFAVELGCADAVTFAGSVTPEALVAFYRQADVFVCLSRHEGFCVPLLEAMVHEVPIVALRATAVPETLGGAGILLPSAAPGLVAAAVHRACSDPSVRSALIAAGRQRLATFDFDASRRRFAAAIRDCCGAP